MKGWGFLHPSQETKLNSNSLSTVRWKSPKTTTTNRRRITCWTSKSSNRWTFLLKRYSHKSSKSLNMKTNLKLKKTIALNWCIWIKTYQNKAMTDLTSPKQASHPLTGCFPRLICSIISQTSLLVWKGRKAADLLSLQMWEMHKQLKIVLNILSKS